MVPRSRFNLAEIRYENHCSTLRTALIFGCSALFCVGISLALFTMLSGILSMPNQSVNRSLFIELIIAPIVEQLVIVSLLSTLWYFKKSPRTTIPNAVICALSFALLHFEVQGGLLRFIVVAFGSTLAFYCWLSVLPFGFKKTLFWSIYMHILNNAIVEVAATVLEKYD